MNDELLWSSSNGGAVTISHQYGSGGAGIAARLAFRLQWRLIDREIAAQVARELDLTDEESELYDEHTFGPLDRLLLLMRFSSVEGAGELPLSLSLQERAYRETLRRVVEDAARPGKVVIVGHGAQHILAKRVEVLHVRVVAPLEQRVRFVMQCEQLSRGNACALIRQKDRQLAYYLRVHHRCHVDDPLLYDLVLNRDELDAESQVDLICLALKRKTHTLRTERVFSGVPYLSF